MSLTNSYLLKRYMQDLTIDNTTMHNLNLILFPNTATILFVCNIKLAMLTYFETSKEQPHYTSALKNHIMFDPLILSNFVLRVSN